ncbi:hypothetical protein GGR50DRAFT_690418 [Xylaria sp. CBS 124048]|nr:hypothetical protein GGR50DRAFT_690418 [Xylaria sp. CBS 124048]
MADPGPSADEFDTFTPPLARSLESPSMQCCCGSSECVFLRHNCAILNNVEKDVHQAARMGQALLARHESYMADAERDRKELTARIEQLEHDNKELEARNAKMLEENEDLLSQLEVLNTAIFDSEAHMKSLEATLLSSQQTIRRLEVETARAEALERQIASLEQDQAEIQSDLMLSREEARSAISRWKRAERGITDLQEQLERIEKSAKQEREHHIEMMSRLEKQREMEKELNTAAGRLKGAAAVRSMAQGNEGGNVVGHFVRDLLQDNANLQFGIAELREMLMNSNDEIQALRNQLEHHQPLGEAEDGFCTPNLSAELELKQSPVRDRTPSTSVSQELHIHHHYHMAAHRHDARKPKRKRPGLTAGVFTPPPSSVSHPNTPPNSTPRYPSVPHSRRSSVRSSRWSTFSDQPSEYTISSSDTSSPRSNNRNSLFDVPPGSFPGSPTSSIDPLSPEWQPVHKRLPSSSMPSRNFNAPTFFPFGPAPPSIAHPIVEEPSDGADILADISSTVEHSAVDDEPSSSPGLGDVRDASSEGPCEIGSHPVCPPITRRLYRGISQESIVSLSGGLDIHTLKSRPSQIPIGQLVSACSVTGSSIVAQPMLSLDSAKRTSALLRDSVGSSPMESLQSHLAEAAPMPRSSKLGKWVGWRPWGGGGNTIRESTTQNGTPLSPQTPKEKDSVNIPPSRPPGINQPGDVPGISGLLLAAAKKAPAGQTTPEVVDHEALREGLNDE